jgi:hypothetical protein
MMLNIPQKPFDAFDHDRCSRWAGCSQALAEQLAHTHRFAIQSIRIRIYDIFGGEDGREEAFWSALLGLTGQKSLPFCSRHIQAVVNRFERLRAIRLNNGKLITFNPKTDIVLLETDPRAATRRIGAVAWGENGAILDMVSYLVPPPSNSALKLIRPRRGVAAPSIPLPISA